MYIYIAGPIAQGNSFLNCAKAIKLHGTLIKLGHYPYCPHLDFIAQMLDPDLEVEKHLLPLDFAWIKKCQALIRMPGDSPGSDLEVAEAKKLGLPIYYGFNEFMGKNK
jgi:hypothetical protein